MSKIKALFSGIQNGHRRMVAKAITLVESTLAQDFEASQQLLQQIAPLTGNALRIGITGVPGVGKSTFIEAFGLFLIEKGFKVAVLAVDPSSPLTGGSIMGDKTRMTELSRNPDAFIRPSPSQGILGGAARKTRESIMICEAAGFDVILVETVGVGQSETLVASMVDLFLVLMLPNAGDELQGIKKGVLELADLLWVNKSDGPQETLAQLARKEYQTALNLIGQRHFGWKTKVLLGSALEQRGYKELWEEIQKFVANMKESGEWETHRQDQNYQWTQSLVEEELKRRFYEDPRVQALLPKVQQSLKSQEILPTQAALKLLKVHQKPLP